jgi:hypothetical protein
MGRYHKLALQSFTRQRFDKLLLKSVLSRRWGHSKSVVWKLGKSLLIPILDALESMSAYFADGNCLKMGNFHEEVNDHELLSWIELTG